MAKENPSGSAGPQKIQAMAMNASESRIRLQQHMAVLQGFGFSDLGTLGNLTIGLQGKPQVAVLQRSGVLLPSQTGPFQAQPELFSGVARKSINTGAFENITGNALVTASRALPVGGTNSGPITGTGTGTGTGTSSTPKSGGASTHTNASSKMAQDIPFNLAYWFATEIVLQDDTTVVLAAGVTSLVIIAEKLSIGQRVTISWERPKEDTISRIPTKPGTPETLNKASNTAGERGRDGLPGLAGGKGNNGQSAPELELWVLQATGYPAIDLRGQDGFIGIRGGDGGDGGRGQEGCDNAKKDGLCDHKHHSGGDGGNGGAAGNGGPGGNGGNGGKFTLFAPQTLINTWFQSGITISVDGGSAGSGGDLGSPGNPGAGGAAGEWVYKICGKNDVKPGSKGNSGSIGNRGPNGTKGILIPNSIQCSGITPSDFYIEAAKPAIISVYPQSALVGDTVTINGNRFAVGDIVMFKGFDGQINVPSTTTFVANNLLTVTVPSIPGGFALLQVVQTDGTLSASKGTLLVKPKIDDTYPPGRIRPGKDYFIKGSGLGRTGNIWINGEDIGPFTVVDNTTIKFKAKRPSNAEVNPAGEKAKLKVVNSEGIGVGNPNHSAEFNIVLDTYRLLVFGDSVVWGGGLPEHQKYYSLAADYVSAKLGNTKVYKTVKAHHGAKIGRGDSTIKPEMPGEMSSRWPTILQQVDTVSSIPDAAEVDLVIIGGGANDLPITDVMMLSDAQNIVQEQVQLTSRTRQYCYDDMIFLLQKVLVKFPKAKVIVTGYFHIVSELSDQNFVQKTLLALIENISNFPSLASHHSDTRMKMIALSNVWVVESNKNLAAAVTSINTNSAEEPRIFFVNPDTHPSNAAHAPNSLLWEPSGVTAPSDPMWKGGREQQRDANESRLKSENGTLGSMWFMTKANSSYHPNPAGAQRFFEKMKPALDTETKARTVAIRCNSGRYVTTTGVGTGYLVGSAPSIGAMETFDLVDLGSNQIALKSATGQYVSAANGGGSTLTATKLRIGSSETFTLVAQTGAKFAFKTANGKYLSTPPNGILVASASTVMEKETFTIL